MEQKDLVELLGWMGELWPHWQQPPTREAAQIRLEAWSRLVGDLDGTAVIAAVERLAADGREFAPPPGLVRKTVAEMTISVGGAPSAEAAWEEIQEKIQRVGWSATVMDTCELCRVSRDPDCSHRRVEFSHPAVSAAVRALGWRNLCMSENQMADRAHFMKLYPNAIEHAVREAATPPSVVAFRGELGQLVQAIGAGA